jgi:hypothetical protein
VKRVAKAKPPKLSGRISQHTLDDDAQYSSIEATAADLTAIGLTPTTAGKLRVVAGGRWTSASYEAVVFGEAIVGRKWTIATKLLTGDKAYKAVHALRKADKRYAGFIFSFDETMDGFSEQQAYAEELDD